MYRHFQKNSFSINCYGLMPPLSSSKQQTINCWKSLNGSVQLKKKKKLPLHLKLQGISQKHCRDSLFPLFEWGTLFLVQPAVSVSVLFLFPSLFSADVSGNRMYGVGAKHVVRMGTADMRSVNCIGENPSSLGFVVMSASIQTSRGSTGN